MKGSTIKAGAIVSTVGRIIISIIVVAGFFWALSEVMAAKIQGSTRELMILMLGALTTKFGDVVVYWIGSSAGLSDKDAAQHASTERLIDAVSTSVPADGKPATPWWGQLTDAEKASITQAAGHDARIKAFMDASAAGAATADDLAYIVSTGLLTQDRAAAISARR